MKIDLNKPETLKSLAYIAIGIIGLILIIRITKKTGEALGIFDTEEEVQAEQKTKKAIEDFEKEAAKTSKPTRTRAQWALVADTIFNKLKYSAVSDDKTGAYNELARILTDADMSLVLSTFGKRQETSFGIPVGKSKTLVQFVQDNFNLEDIADLNKLYSRSKMKFKF
jgi:UTP:GlnB (protein PII) uridylyltransferase